MTRTEVKLASPHHRFVIALHLLVCSRKPDCSNALRRKSRQNWPTHLTITFSLVQFQRKNRRIAPSFRYFQSNPGGFLCTADCMAEREGFEPSIQLWAPKSPRVRKLQIAKAEQRISRRNAPCELRVWSGFLSLFDGLQRRSDGDGVAESGHHRRSHIPV